MPVAEIVLIVITAVGSWSDVLLSTFNLCMQGSCRSECCCVEMSHDDAEVAASRRSLSDAASENPAAAFARSPEIPEISEFTKELK